MLEGLLAPLRVVLHRSSADWLIVVATWLVIVCATTLLAIGVLYGDAVALSRLRQVIAAEPVAATSVVVDMRVDPEELASVDEVVSHQTRRILGWTDGELARIITSGTYDLAGAVADADETDLTAFAAADRLELLAEEPTGQLDSHTGHAIMGLLRTVVRTEGVTAVVATHDPAILDLADRVLEIHDGMPAEAMPEPV